jgi:xanthine dehydrogenase small subunit
MTLTPIHFIRRGELARLDDVPPTRTLLQVLREDLKCVGTKEGCNEGDCGACTVVLGEAVDGNVTYSAVNSCIRFAHAIDGKALWTVEDIAPTLHRSRGSLPPEGARFVLGRPGDENSAPALAAENILHPAQQAMVDCFGSQCGFCTPGFVMSLFATYQNRVCKGETVTREAAQHDLSGNLCRCTGYRPILDAAQAMAALPAVRLDEKALLAQLAQLAKLKQTRQAEASYQLPQTLAALLQARARHPAAQIVAGGTDVGLWVNKLHMDFDTVIDVTQVAELRRIERYPHHLAIGAAASLNEAFAALRQDRPQLGAFFDRFAGLPVRNSGTLGGNVVNGSPIGDSMPLLIALQSSIVLMRWANGQVAHRELKVEDFYTGYRKNRMQPGEVLAWIKVPLPTNDEFLRAYKISKRFEDDISAVCLVLNLRIQQGKVALASLGAGGVAATPARAAKTEAFLRGQPWTQATVAQAQAVLRQEFSPISDMRASSQYRSLVLGNLLQRFWLEHQGADNINLESALADGKAGEVAA